MAALLRGYTPQGYAVQTDRFTGKVLAECDTYTCNHCQRVIHVPSTERFEARADFCHHCSKVICAKCADAWDKRTFIQKVEQEEDRDAKLNVLRKLGLV